MDAPEARLNKYRGRYAEAEGRYGPKPNVYAAVEEYCRIAQHASIQPYELAIRCASSHTSSRNFDDGDFHFSFGARAN
jgi:hypothetical protein